jgi:hypothetical protein
VSDLVERLRMMRNAAATEAADRIEQLEREKKKLNEALLNFFAEGEFFYAGEGDADEWAVRKGRGIKLDSLAKAFGYSCAEEVYYEIEHGSRDGWYAHLNGYDTPDQSAEQAQKKE